MNTNAIADGALVNFSFATLLTTPTGNFTISLTQLQCSTPTGTAVATTANPPQSISVSSVVSPNACDLNGDGLVNSADYDKARANLLASPQVPNIGTAIPTIMDVQIVANAANGASCTLGGGAAPITVTLASFTCAPSSFPAGGSSSCTARLSAAAPSAGAVIALSTPCSAVRLLASLTIPAGLLSAVTDANTSSGVPPQSCNVSGTYNGTTQTAVLMLQ
jgi:hypothetical protein